MFLGSGDRPTHDDRIPGVSTACDIGHVDQGHQILVRGSTAPVSERFTTVDVDLYSVEFRHDRRDTRLDSRVEEGIGVGPGT